MNTISPFGNVMASPLSVVTVTSLASWNPPPEPWMKCDHSQACEPKKKNPPTMVAAIQRTTPRLSLRCPASTANTMVTEDTMSRKVMRAT